MQYVRNKGGKVCLYQKIKAEAIDKIKPWVVDQVLELVVYVHWQAKESSAPFDFPHCPSAQV